MRIRRMSLCGCPRADLVSLGQKPDASYYPPNILYHMARGRYHARKDNTNARFPTAGHNFCLQTSAVHLFDLYRGAPLMRILLSGHSIGNTYKLTPTTAWKTELR